jgi:hypothetical protein
MRPGTCAKSCSGAETEAAAPPRKVMNSRRSMSAPKLRRQHHIGLSAYFGRGSNRRRPVVGRARLMSQLGQKLP